MGTVQNMGFTSWRLLILSFLFVIAFCLRLYGIGDLPTDVVSVRQYHSALLARGFYEWLLTGELVTVPPDGVLEPPILELVTSFLYLTFGGEYLWIPRVLSATFWMIGGIFLYNIAVKISSPNAAFFSVFFYLFVPFSLLWSRAFMPDPLMVMMLVISLFTILRYQEQPSTRRLLIAATAASLAVFVKPGICFFQIFGAFVALAAYRRGIVKALVNSHFLIFAALSILPVMIYYLYGAFGADFLEAKLSERFRPLLLLETSFWYDPDNEAGWVVQIGEVVGYTALVGALLGTLLLRPGSPRYLMVGLWGGYLLFGCVFTQHIFSHNYYSLQLIPVVALALGPVVSLALIHVSQLLKPEYPSRVGLRRYLSANVGQVIVLPLFVSALVLSAAEYKHPISEYVEVQQTHFAVKYAPLIEGYKEIGEVVDHSPRTLLLFSDEADYFGYPLLYHGQFSAKEWPRYEQEKQEKQMGMPELDTAERFDLYAEYSPEYFIISANHWNNGDYKELRNFLTKNFSLKAEGKTASSGYVVFDLRDEQQPLE